MKNLAPVAFVLGAIGFGYLAHSMRYPPPATGEKWYWWGTFVDGQLAIPLLVTAMLVLFRRRARTSRVVLWTFGGVTAFCAFSTAAAVARAATVCQLLPWSDVPPQEIVAAFWSHHFALCSVPREGAAEVLEHFRERGVPMGIVTNGAARVQDAKIDVLGIRHYMKAIAISGAIGIKKPDPRIFHAALAEIGCPREGAWFVGDHPRNDVLGAEAAGLMPVWLSHRHPWPEESPPPKHWIALLSDLLCFFS